MAIEYKEIRKATGNFGHDMVLGKGRFGTVYKGWIDKDTLTAVKPGFGITVAVKKLNNEGYDGYDMVLRPLQMIGKYPGFEDCFDERYPVTRLNNDDWVVGAFSP